MNEERLGNFNLADDRQLKVAYYTFDGVEEPIYTIWLCRMLYNSLTTVVYFKKFALGF